MSTREILSRSKPVEMQQWRSFVVVFKITSSSELGLIPMFIFLLQIVEEFIFSMNVIFSPRCCTTTKSSEQSISLLPAPSRRKCHWSPRDALNHRLRTKGNLLENKFSTSFNTISSLSSVRALVRFVLLCVFSCYPSAALCVRSPTRSGPCLSRVYSNYETISHEEWTGSKSSNNEMMLMMMKQRRERETKKNRVSENARHGREKSEALSGDEPESLMKSQQTTSLEFGAQLMVFISINAPSSKSWWVRLLLLAKFESEAEWQKNAHFLKLIFFHCFFCSFS